jgi:hypothetical protein
MTTKTRFFPALAMLGLATMAAPASAQIFGQTDPDVFRCESVSSREVTCRLPAGKSATFEEQHSQSACTLRSSYWIYSDRVVVSKGCRASFRVHDNDTVELADVRAELSDERARKIRSDNNFGSTPSIAILTERQRDLGASRISYEGTARVTVKGAPWKTVQFSSEYDLRTRDLSNLDYWTEGTPTGDASERRSLLRDRLDDAMEDKLDAEFRNVRGANPRFELLTDEERTISSNVSGYSGTGRISIDGKEWTNVTFESTYDWRADRFTALDYGRTAGYGGRGMDPDAERSLAAALAAEVRRQLGSGDVQVAINRRYSETGKSNGKVTYTGKFGYSWNDGDWVTRGFEAVLNPAGYNVRELRIYRAARSSR